MNDIAVRYFKKQSKLLLKKYEKKTPWAVWYTEKFLRDSEAVSLTRAQFVMARSVGYQSWNEFLKSNDFMQMQAMQAHGVQIEMNGFRQLRRHNETRKEAYFRYLEGQARIAQSVKVKEIHDWLIANIEKIKTPNTGSYGFKHKYEKYFGYTANGELILAAILGRYAYKQIDFGLNAKIAFGKKSIKKALENLDVGKSKNEGKLSQELIDKGLMPSSGLDTNQWREIIEQHRT